MSSKSLNKFEQEWLNDKLTEGKELDINRIEWNGDEMRADILGRELKVDIDTINNLTQSPQIAVKKVDVDGEPSFVLNTNNCGAVDFEEMATFAVHQLLITLAKALIEHGYKEHKVKEMVTEWLEIKLEEMPDLVMKEALKDANASKTKAKKLKKLERKGYEGRVKKTS